MAEYEPIVITDREVRSFAEQAARFESSLDDDERRIWQTIIVRAGGQGDGGDAADLARAFATIWEDGTQIAPLYSGAMPPTGHTD